jgi:hypothetical protein
MHQKLLWPHVAYAGLITAQLATANSGILKPQHLLFHF